MNIVKTEFYKGHSEMYAENAAENYVLGNKKLMPYSKEVNDRFYNVLNNPKKFSVGRFDPKDPDVATGMTGAPACGDVMKLQLKT